MMSVTFRQDTSGLDALEQSVPRNINARVRQAVEIMQAEIRENWSASSPSSPGNPPAIKTGNLDQSVRPESTGRTLRGTWTSGNDAAMWTLRIGAWYAGNLEHGYTMAPRPFVLPAALRTYEKLPDLFSDAISIKVNTQI